MRRPPPWSAGLLLTALVGAPGPAVAADSGPAPGSGGRSEVVDAEMLRDLDVLSNPDYARDHEVAKRLSLFERLRLLEAQPTPAPTQPAPAPSSGVK